MIHALDHIALAAPSPDAAAQSCATLLGHGAGKETSLQLANVRLDLVASGALEEGGFAGLAFAVADLAKAEHLLARRGLRVHGVDAASGHRHLHVATDSTHGVPISLIERAPDAKPMAGAPTDPASAVTGLDHIVIRTPNPERAVALYAGRLGLSLRLDRSEPSWGARLLFFRCGDLVVEVAHDLKAGIGDGPDKLWGLSWRVPDAALAHAHLTAAGVEVSEVRKGRRPGTRIFTVRSHTAGVPTIIIGPEPKM